MSLNDGYWDAFVNIPNKTKTANMMGNHSMNNEVNSDDNPDNTLVLSSILC